MDAVFDTNLAETKTAASGFQAILKRMGKRFMLAREISALSQIPHSSAARDIVAPRIAKARKELAALR